MNPDCIEFKIEITLPLRDWKRIASKIKECGNCYLFPLNTITNSIDDIITQAEKHFYSEYKETDK